MLKMKFFTLINKLMSDGKLKPEQERVLGYKQNSISLKISFA